MAGRSGDDPDLCLEGKLDAVRNEKRQYKVRRVPCFKALFMIR